ncbi:MAG: prepilin-type N-terminal cleavage/methylation domain-containing protein [Planctomycetaceae bacterium]|jgi:prepilin-type N-terminal cleavage/methylation domain-containing protein|nr:prepilin-type N-terminal cleavage/methylation domain-containing protein [Planctomycetaceae bacterium]
MKKSFFMHCSRKGITLIEVLVSVFIIGIGLLGVLAVIPFGAYQVSKAEQAKYTANALANAAETLKIRGLANPAHWGLTVLSSGGTTVYDKDTVKLNCSKLLWVEPYRMNDPASHIFRIGGLFMPQNDENDGKGCWKEWMRGQDDLEYEIDETANRPVYKKDKDGNIKSTGRYAWFFTYQPKAAGTVEDGLSDYETTADVDILGCCNRIQGNDEQVAVSDFAPSLNGGVLKLNADKTEELSQTKYILVTWDGTSPDVPPGSAWCKVLFAKEKDVMVTGALNNFDAAANRQAYIVNGVLYHKRVHGVKIKD